MAGLTFRDARDLPSLLEDPAQPVVIVAGAWLSVPVPSAVPDAWRWKRQLVTAISAAGRWPHSRDIQVLNDGLSNLGTGEDIKLERVLEAIEGALPGAGGRIVYAVTDTQPNPLHEWTASLLSSGAVTHMVTLNFDDLVERCCRTLSVWSTGDRPEAARVMHVHGRASEPSSLRHVLARFALRLPEAEHAVVAQVLQAEVVCMGWAATDPDVLAALREGAAPVHVLIAGDLPAEDTDRYLMELAEHRPVLVYRGGFERMWAGGGPSIRTATPAEFRPALDAIDREVASLALADARRAYVALSYEYSIGLRHNVDHAGLLTRWKALGLGPPRERYLYVLSLAEHLQATGHPARAVLLNLRAFLMSRDPYLLSEAGDAAERLLGSRLPGRGVLGLALHSLSAGLYRRDRRKPPAWVEARRARSLLRLGMDGRAQELLDAVLEADPDTTGLWVRAHAHRLRAIALAGRENSWRDDIETAKHLFRFAGRTLEVGSTFRAEALCEMLEGKPEWRGRAQACLDGAAARYRLASDASANGLIRFQAAVVKSLPRRLGAFVLKSL
jgi:hypothetical protein